MASYTAHRLKSQHCTVSQGLCVPGSALHPAVLTLRDTDSVGRLAARLRGPPPCRRLLVVGNGGIALELVGALQQHYAANTQQGKGRQKQHHAGNTQQWPRQKGQHPAAAGAGAGERRARTSVSAPRCCCAAAATGAWSRYQAGRLSCNASLGQTRLSRVVHYDGALLPTLT